MPIRSYEDSFVGLTPSDDKVHHILPDYQRNQAGCPHGIEFWVAIRTVSRDDEPLVLQWCMSCRRVEVLRLDEYNWRTSLAELWKDDVPDRPDRLDRPDRREPDTA